MKKLVGVGIALMVAGCASVEMAQYTVTSFAEIPLKERAKVKIVANGDGFGAIADSIKSEFKKNGKFSIVDGDADYWFVLTGAKQYSTSASQRKVSVAKKENQAGGTDVFAESKNNLASAAEGVSVAVYEAKTLTPVHYFEMPVYAGDNTKDAVRGAAEFDAGFSKEIVERISDAFITRQKQVETPIPLEADGNLRGLFAKGGQMFEKDGAKAYDSFLGAYKTRGISDPAGFFEQLRTKTYGGSDADVKLGNYYLYLLVKEATTLDPAELANIRDQQLKILESSSAKGLAEAVPVALARLEYKLANIGD